MSQPLKEFLETKRIELPYLIGNGILPIRGKAIIAGEPKANKSFLVLNMMLALAKGENLLEDARYKDGTPLMPVNNRWRVLYLEQELGEQGLLERLKGKDEGHPGLVATYTPEQLADLDIHIKPRDTAMRLDTLEGEAFLGREVAAVKPDVVFMDPFAKFHLRDENSSQEMSMVLRAMDHIIENNGCAIVLIHHLNKLNPEHPRTGGARVRGSSAIFGDIDTLISVDRKSNEHDPEPVLELTFTLRRGEPIPEMFVQRRRDGTVHWMGEGYRFGEKSLNSGIQWPQGKYRSK